MATSSRPVLLPLLTIGTLAAALYAPVPAHAATARPDLVVPVVSPSTTLLVAGNRLAVATTVRNAGTARAATTSTRFWLSKDTTRSSGDVALGTHATPALAAKAQTRFSASLSVPKSTAARTWHVIACADSAATVRESNEANNCRASSSIKVIAPGYFPQTPAPLTVTPAFGTATLATGSYPYAYADDANTVTATGPDGTTYTLDVPAQAVNRGVGLTISAITGLTGAPTSLIAGVRLRPAGLLLAKDATLTITPAATYPASGLTAFRFFEGGRDAGMYPIRSVDPTTHAVTLSIGELGSYAIGTSTAAQRSTARAHPPHRPLGQLFNVLGALHRPASAPTPATPATSAGVAPPPTDIAAWNTFYDTVLKPQLVAAETDDSLARTAVSQALMWAHQTAVLGGESNPRIADAQVEMLKILANAVKQEYARCTAQSSIVDLGLLIGNARSYAVLGAEADASNTFDKARACGRFSFSFDDWITSQQYFPAGGQGPTSQGLDSHQFLEVATAAPITMQLDQFGAFDGTGTLVYKKHAYTVVNTIPGDTCTLTTTTTITKTTDGSTGGTIATLGLDLQWNPEDVGPGVVATHPADGQIVLSFTGGFPDAMPSETVHTQDGGCSSGSSTYADHIWALRFHHYPGSGGSDGFVLPVKRSEQAGAVLFDHTYTWDNGGAGDIHNSHDTEHTVVQIKHLSP